MVEGSKATDSDDGFDVTDKRVDSDCWVKSGFESLWMFFSKLMSFIANFFAIVPHYCIKYVF